MAIQERRHLGQPSICGVRTITLLAIGPAHATYAPIPDQRKFVGAIHKISIPVFALKINAKFRRKFLGDIL
jgi:hypothetical protein